MNRMELEEFTSRLLDMHREEMTDQEIIDRLYEDYDLEVSSELKQFFCMKVDSEEE